MFLSSSRTSVAAHLPSEIRISPNASNCTLGRGQHLQTNLSWEDGAFEGLWTCTYGGGEVGLWEESADGTWPTNFLYGESNCTVYVSRNCGNTFNARASDPGANHHATFEMVTVVLDALRQTVARGGHGGV